MLNNLKKYLPIEYKKTIYDIDYDKYYKLGFNTIFFDLDNTIASYDTFVADKKIIELFNDIKEIGYKIYILSNNVKKERVDGFSNTLGCKGYNALCKPYTFKINRFIKKDNIDLSKTLWIGDQMVTDSKCASKLNIKMILVDPINRKSERWYTDINRFLEELILRKIEKKLNKEYLDLGLDKRWIYKK